MTHFLSVQPPSFTANPTGRFLVVSPLGCFARNININIHLGKIRVRTKTEVTIFNPGSADNKL